MSANESLHDVTSSQKSIDVNDSKDNSSQDALPISHQQQPTTQSSHSTHAIRPASAILSPPNAERQLSHVTNNQPSTYEVGHTSLQGVRPSMEDEVCIEQSFTIGESHKYSFYAVFDGHGGRSAAEYTRDHLLKYIQDSLAAGDTPSAALTYAYLKVDQEFIDEQQQLKAEQQDGRPINYANQRSTQTILSTSLGAHRDPSTGRSDIQQQPAGDCSGTTAVSVLIDHTAQTLYIANVGDSRAVLCSGGRAIALTKDHKADRPDEAERIRRAGGFVVHKRVMGELAVSRAIGDMEFKEKGFVFVVAEPEIDVRHLNQHDEFLLLACDGLYDVMSNSAAVEYIRTALYEKQISAQQVTQDIVSYAIDKLNTRDNVTAIIVKLKQNVNTAADLPPLSAVQQPNSSPQSTESSNNHIVHGSSTQSTKPQPIQLTGSRFQNGSDSPTTPTVARDASRLSISDKNIASLFDPPA